MINLWEKGDIDTVTDVADEKRNGYVFVGFPSKHNSRRRVKESPVTKLNELLRNAGRNVRGRVSYTASL